MSFLKKIDLTKAFRELRTKGYYAKQDFLCCQSCAWSAIPEEVEDKVVFYHGQDSADLKDNGSCHLGWSGDGNEIVEVLKKHGIGVEWDGSDNQRIKINLDS